MGFKVNLRKSEIVLVGSVAVVWGLALMLGGKVTFDLFGPSIGS